MSPKSRDKRRDRCSLLIGQFNSVRSCCWPSSENGHQRSFDFLRPKFSVLDHFKRLNCDQWMSRIFRKAKYQVSHNKVGETYLYNFTFKVCLPLTCNACLKGERENHIKRSFLLCVLGVKTQSDKLTTCFFSCQVWSACFKSHRKKREKEPGKLSVWLQSSATS